MKLHPYIGSYFTWHLGIAQSKFWYFIIFQLLKRKIRQIIILLCQKQEALLLDYDILNETKSSNIFKGPETIQYVSIYKWKCLNVYNIYGVL
jgi:hypothetical protein